MAEFAKDYVDVAERLRSFKEKYPDGSLQPVNPDRPIEVMTVNERTFLAYTAAAYRNQDDARPGIGTAWEPFPGKTPYTRDSEAMNAETSAWGRAIVAALAADTKRGVASFEDVRNRQMEHDEPLGPDSPPGVIRARIKAAGEANSLTIQEITEDFHEWSKGEQIGTAPTAVLLEYLQHLAPKADG